jgi:hypothetical protein
LVFQPHKSNAQKPKELEFSQRSKKSDNNYAGQKDLTNFVIY